MKQTHEALCTILLCISVTSKCLITSTAAQRQLQPFCSLFAAFLQPFCSLFAAFLQPFCSLSAAFLQPFCSLFAALLEPFCSLSAASLQPFCSLLAAFLIIYFWAASRPLFFSKKNCSTSEKLFYERTSQITVVLFKQKQID